LFTAEPRLAHSFWLCTAPSVYCRRRTINPVWLIDWSWGLTLQTALRLGIELVSIDIATGQHERHCVCVLSSRWSISLLSIETQSAQGSQLSLSLSARRHSVSCLLTSMMIMMMMMMMIGVRCPHWHRACAAGQELTSVKTLDLQCFH